MKITAIVAKELSLRTQKEDESAEEVIKQQLISIEDDIYKATSEGHRVVKTALLVDDVDFFKEISIRLQHLGFKDLHFLSVDIDNKLSAVLKIKW